jgi:hypothetical protein
MLLLIDGKRNRDKSKEHDEILMVVDKEQFV